MNPLLILFGKTSYTISLDFLAVCFKVCSREISSKSRLANDVTQKLFNSNVNLKNDEIRLFNKSRVKSRDSTGVSRQCWANP